MKSIDLSLGFALAVAPAGCSLVTILTHHGWYLLHDCFPNGRGSQKLLEGFPHPGWQSSEQSGSNSALPGAFLL